VIVIAERINATRKRIRKAILNRDANHIRREAKKQLDAGGTYIDANAGIEASREADDLCWLVETIQAEVDAPCSLDSTNSDAIAAALKVHKGTPLINSVTAEEGRHEAVLPLAAEHGTPVVALCLRRDGMPMNVEERLEGAAQIVELITAHGLPLDRVFFDPIIVAVATSPAGDAGRMAIDTVRSLHETYPDAHITCGLSNISFGLPRRNVLNRNFLPMLMSVGLDSAIIDPTEPCMMSSVVASEALLGLDEFCMNYITADRGGQLA
jgi:5-methyltetrahydrofolate--homocysteine methyltransferase